MLGKPAGIQHATRGWQLHVSDLLIGKVSQQTCIRQAKRTPDTIDDLVVSARMGGVRVVNVIFQITIL